MSRGKETRELIAQLRRIPGIRVAMSTSNHWKVFRYDRLICTLSHSCSDVHGVRKARRELRAKGVPVPAR